MNNQLTIHATLLRRDELGILLIADSGAGKTDAVVELISRYNYQLISDDSVLLSTNNNQLIGKPPFQNANFLHIRDIGVVNVPRLFSKESILNESPINFIVKIKTTEKKQPDTTKSSSKTELLGMIIPTLTIHYADKRPLSTLIDIAAQCFILEKSGYNPMIDLEQWQEQLLQ